MCRKLPTLKSKIARTAADRAKRVHNSSYDETRFIATTMEKPGMLDDQSLDITRISGYIFDEKEGKGTNPFVSDPSTKEKTALRAVNIKTSLIQPAKGQPWGKSAIIHPSDS